MADYSLSSVEVIKGKVSYYQVEIDGVGVLDVFEKELEGSTFLSEYNTLLAWMDKDANLERLPKKKKNFLNGVNVDSIFGQIFEYKSKHLRIYCVAPSGGRVIILAGKKNTQVNDIRQIPSRLEMIRNIIGGIQNEEK